MDLRKILSKDVITEDLRGETKEEIIDSLIDLLEAAGRIGSRERVKECIMAREARMSTGMENGVAIPHGKCDAVDELAGCIGITRSGVDFDAFDKKPSRIFIMTVSPMTHTGPHVQFLSEISRILRDPGMRQSLLDAESAEEIQTIICD